MNLNDTYLSDRGLSHKTAADNGIEIDQGPLDQRRIVDRLGQHCVPLWDLAREIIWFPMYGPDGARVSWWARPLPTLKEPKFVRPTGNHSSPYVPKGVYGIVAGAPLIVTEGPVKALVCDQAGIASIGINGVWCSSAQLPSGKLVLRQEIGDLNIRARKIYIAFDADSTINADVRHAMIRLFLLLSAAGAEVYQLTSWDIAEGKGIDDYLVGQQSQGVTAKACLDILIADAAPFADTIHNNKVDLDAVSSELSKVDLAHLFRIQLCGELAPRLKIPVDELRKIGLEAPKPKGVSFDSTPSPWPNAVDGEGLFHDISSIIRRHIIVDNKSLTAVTLWIVLCYLIDVVDTLPLLAITSPERRCGKTRFLALLRRLTKRPLPSSNISSAALYRAIEKYIPTLIVDEADVVFEHNDELRCLFNSGHTRDTAFVLRAERENGDVLSFSTWAPKAIALIGKLPPTLADRSILVGMRRRSKTEKIQSLRKTPAIQFEERQQRLVRWADDNKTTIAAADPKLPEYLNDRAADNWHPLLAIAECAGPDWRDFALHAMRAMNKADADDDSVVTVLLTSLRKVFRARRTAFVATNDILTALNADQEAPWADCRQGKGLSAEKLRRILAPFEVHSVQEQNNNVRARGYKWETLRPVFERYL